MKEYFTALIQGHMIKFSRVSYSAFDNWYHIAVQIDKREVLCRMSKIAEGKWKIQTPRTLPFIRSIENLCSEEIRKNEVLN
jgi:hypothetical protein